MSFDDEALDDGPLSYWPMRGLTAGAAGTDVVRGEHLAWLGAPTFGVDGPAGDEAVAFDGISQVGHSPLTRNTPTMGDPTASLEVWFQAGELVDGFRVGAVQIGGGVPTTTTDPYATTACCRTSAVVSDDSTLHMIHRADGVQVGYREGSFNGQSPKGYNNGRWHQRVDTIDGSKYRIYIDGAQVAEWNQKPSSSPALTHVTVGANLRTLADGPTQFFVGAACRLVLYGHTLSATRVLAHRVAGMEG